MKILWAQEWVSLSEFWNLNLRNPYCISKLRCSNGSMDTRKSYITGKKLILYGSKTFKSVRYGWSRKQSADAAGPLGDWSTQGVYARLPREF